MNAVALQKSRGISRGMCLAAGYFLLFAKVVGDEIGRRVVSLDGSGGMTAATVAIVLKTVGAVALPVFAMLVGEEFEESESKRKYLAAFFLLTFVSEIPYDIVSSGNLINNEGQNPLFGVLLSMVVVWYMCKYPNKKAVDIIVRAAVISAAVFWCIVLRVEGGCLFVLTVAAVYLFRNKEILRTFVVAAILAVAAAVSLYCALAPMGAMCLNLRSRDEGRASLLNTAFIYPLILVFCSIIFAFI